MPLPSNFFLLMEKIWEGFRKNFMGVASLHSFLLSRTHDMVTFGPTPNLIALAHSFVRVSKRISFLLLLGSR